MVALRWLAAGLPSSLRAFTGLALACGNAVATDYTLKADAYWQQTYNSNILLLPAAQRPEQVFGSELNLQTLFQATDAVWTAKGNARFDQWFYYPVSGLDMQNQYVDGQFAYLTERGKWELSAGYINDALLSSNSAQIQGIVLGRVNREIWNVLPMWRYSLSEYTKVSLSYHYVNSKYPSNSFNYANFDAAFPDSTSHTVASTLNHLISQYWSVDGLLAAVAFDAQGREINYLNLVVGSTYAVGENTVAGVSIGGQYSQTKVSLDTLGYPDSLRDDSFTPLFDVNVKHQWKDSLFSLGYSQQSTPSINSNLFKSDAVTVSARQRLSPTVEGNLSFSYNKISTPAQAGASVGQNYYQLAGNVSYNFAERAAVSASYAFQSRDIEDGLGIYSDPQYAHSVSVNLRYHFDVLPQ